MIDLLKKGSNSKGGLQTGEFHKLYWPIQEQVEILIVAYGLSIFNF